METMRIDLDKLKKENWSSEEYNNAELVVDFVQHIMNDHDFDYVRSKFGGNRYRQHNQTMTDGLEGVLKVVSDFTKSFPEFTYDVKHVYVDGPNVILHSHATANKSHRGNPQKGMNIMDIWKVENGELVEHWDAVQPIHAFMRAYALMSGGKFKNENTYF